MPRRGIYGNMITAVDKVNKGEGRTVNARFSVMCVHYLFDPDFCNVASGWEKGSRLHPSRIVFIADETVIASHERLFDRDQVLHYIPLIERKPGALRNGAPFADLPKPLRLLKRGLRRHTNGDRIMMQVLAAVPIAGLKPVLVAVELVLESGSLSADHILNVLARLTSTAPPPCVETSLQLKVAPVANTAHYDRLRTTDEENRNA